jgi:hypothetical protein
MESQPHKEKPMELVIEISEKALDYLRRGIAAPEEMASAIIEARVERFGNHGIEKPSFLRGPEK